MNNDLISVIVPVYNDDKYVAQALDSIVSQTYRNLEILVVVDGSKDSSPAICDRYAAEDERVKVFHRENAGVAASRQFGVDNCQGTYFVTIDADDYVAADFVEKLYETIKKNNADISVCGVTCFADGSNQIGLTIMPSETDDRVGLTKEILLSEFYQLSCDFIQTDSWNKMHRTQFVRDSNVEYRLPKKYCGSELELEHRLLLHCPVYCVCRESLLFHRNRKGSLMQRKDNPFQEGFEMIMESLIKESEMVGIPVRMQLGRIYNGLLGIVVWDIFIYGGGVKERHTRYKTLVNRRRHFLRKHREHFDKCAGLKTYSVSNALKLPAFTLSNALWLDAVALSYLFLRKLKYR